MNCIQSNLTGASRCSSGLALPVVLISLLVVGMIMFAMSHQSRNEKQLLTKLIASQKLVYLVRSGMAIAETKLAKERWYGDTNPRDVIVPTLDEPGASLKIYVDDYVQMVARRYQTVYRMLDHVKVFVEARYHKDVMYGFGKFILSPEPVFDGRSTIGVTGTRQSYINSSGESVGFIGTVDAPTMRRIVGVKYLTENEIYQAVPTFAGLADVESRRALGRFWVGDQIPYARMYARNQALMMALNDPDLELPTTSDNCLEIESCRSFLHQLDLPSNAAVSAEQTSDENVLKNTFVGESLKNFFLSTNWDISREKRDIEQKKIQIYIPYLPPKCTDTNVIRAVGMAFGAQHPISVRAGIDFIATFTFDHVAKQTATQQYLVHRGYSDAYPSVSPAQFGLQISRIQTANAYTVSWSATMVTDGPAPETLSEEGDLASVDRFFELYDNRGGTTVVDETTVTILDASISPVSGPDPYYSDYYIRIPDTPQNYTLANIVNFFLKYLDDTMVELPPNKNTGYTQPAEDSDDIIDPFVEGGSNFVALF